MQAMKEEEVAQEGEWESESSDGDEPGEEMEVDAPFPNAAFDPPPPAPAPEAARLGGQPRVEGVPKAQKVTNVAQSAERGSRADAGGQPRRPTISGEACGKALEIVARTYLQEGDLDALCLLRGVSRSCRGVFHSPSTINLEPGTRNPKPVTRNPRPQTLNPEP